MDTQVHHLLLSGARRRPDGVALSYRDHRVTFGDAIEATGHIAGALRMLGLGRGARLGVMLEPSIELPLSLLAAARAGAAFVPIHPSLLADQVEHIVRDCGMTGIIVDGRRFEALAPALAACRSLRCVIAVDAPAGAPAHDWAGLAAAGARPPLDAGIDRDLAAILYTSGSTGKPKGVMLSHANVMAGAAIVSDYLGIGPEDRILAVLPFSFDAGLNQLTTALRQGGTCVMLRWLFAREIVTTLAHERITGLAGVPPLWNLLVQDSARLAETPLPELRYVTNTGGALPLPTLERLRRAQPQARVFLMYGLTEAFRSTYLPPEELDRRPTSMGKAIPNTEILVLREDGTPCEPGEVGELVHRGPTVSLGYWGDPERTDRVLRPNPLAPPELLDSERVCYSGDLVRMDEDGFLYFVGRRDNLIKSSGFRISPTEVEAALSRTGLVRDAAVVGVPDDLLGQRIIAFVVARDGLAVTGAQVLSAVGPLLPRHMLPKAVEVLPDVPKTSSGKIDYPMLRARALDVRVPDHA